jgi:uncharacterized protein
MLKSFLTAALLSISFSAADAEDPKLIRNISLSGHGETRVTPDIATINMGVMSSAENAKDALAANTKAMTDLMTTLKAANIESKDISTTNFSVNPRYDYSQNNGQPPKVTGYDVSNTVMVTVRKLDQVGELLDKSVTSGSNLINGISFSVANPQAALDQARQEAVKDAKRKADLYAAAASVTVGNVIAISEGGGYQNPVMMQGKMMAADAGSGAPVPIAQGEQVIGIDVNITWELK